MKLYGQICKQCGEKLKFSDDVIEYQCPHCGQWNRIKSK